MVSASPQGLPPTAATPRIGSQHIGGVYPISTSTLDDIVAPNAAPIRLNKGEAFLFTEGPVWDHEGRLYFSDSPSNRIMRVERDGSIMTFASATDGGNGMALSHDGRLYVCHGRGNRISAYDTETGQAQTVVDSYGGKPLNAPNDLVLDRSGGLYFTDPVFPAAGQRLSQDVEAVYYLAPSGGLHRICDGIAKPNGIVLTNDEATLLVADSFGKYVWALDLGEPGAMKHAYEWGALEVPEAAYVLGPGGAAVQLEGHPEATIADGMCLDAAGRLYVTAQQGVQVLGAGGNHIGTLTFPEQPANCCFGGGDLTTLFVTAQTSVYSLQMQVAGLRMPLG